MVKVSTKLWSRCFIVLVISKLVHIKTHADYFHHTPLCSRSLCVGILYNILLLQIFGDIFVILIVENTLW